MANGLQGLNYMGISCDNCILPKLLTITCQFLSWTVPGVTDRMIPDCGNLVCTGHQKLTYM